MTDAAFPTFKSAWSGVEAIAQVRHGRFFVLMGSNARATVLPSLGDSYAKLRDRLLSEAKLVSNPQIGHLQFVEDVEFNSPSAAAAVVLGRQSNGNVEWLLTSDETTTYGQWLERQHPSAVSSRVASPLEPLHTTWQPFFRALALKLLEYENRQPELVQHLRDAGVNVQHDEGEPLTEIDPFTFFSMILKHNSAPKVQKILESLRVSLGIAAAVPDDLNGVPWSAPQAAWYFSYRNNRQPGDIALLWRLARQTLAGTLEPETFADSLAIKQVALAKLTQGLFWLNPEAFLALNSINVPYLEARGVRGAGKVATLEEFEAVLEASRALAPDFVTLSHAAWVDAQATKETAVLEDGRFPWTAFQADAAKHPSDHVKGNMLIDRKYAPLLLQLAQETAPDALKPSRSPFSGRDQFAARIALSAPEDGAFAHLLLLPVEGFEVVPLTAGLTLTVGVADAKGEAFRQALRIRAARDRLKEALLRTLPFQSPVRLSIATFAPLPLTTERLADLSKQLEVYSGIWESARRFQMHLTLTPQELQGETFGSLLEAAFEYADALKSVLEELSATPLPVSVAPAAVVQAAGAPATPEPAGFTPPSGVPLNQILYGPPGTGKTHRVVDEALRVLEPGIFAQHPASDGRTARKARYDQLLQDGQITFVTFHQSFGYEDFIEGIKPVMRGAQLHYELEDGLFLQAVRASGGTLEGGESVPAPPRAAAVPEVNSDGQVWRMYIDGTAPVSQLRTRSLERGEIRIGSWLNFPSAFQDRVAVNQNAPVSFDAMSEEQLHPQQVMFKDAVRNGDLVLLATGNDTINAIGVVTGDYFFDQSEAIFASQYAHARPVRWLAKNLNWKATEITGKKFAPATLQRVLGLSPERVLALLNGAPQAAPAPSSRLRPHVLVVDEINRGNVAKVFGELITLLEPSKRAGAAEGLTVRLPLSKRRLSVPQSLYIIGTMNTADRSLTALDAALRRRFVFHPVWPDPRVLPVIDLDGTALDLPAFLNAINLRIERLLSREQVIGHAYLLDIPATLEGVAQALQQRILPLLEEYFFEDWERIRQVLGDDQKPVGMQFIRVDVNGDSKRFERNPQAFASVEAFVRVYSGSSDLDVEP